MPITSLLRPETIAVLGASRDPHKWGQRVIRYTRSAGFAGELFAVNPLAEPGSIPGATVLADVGDAPGRVDCAFLALPRERTADAVRACCDAGVGTIVVAASGFGESSSAGADLERELLDLAAPTGTRLLGPNCFGVYSSVPGINLTPFAYVPRGEVAMVSQSGNVSAQLFLAAARAGIGFSHCIGIGNQLDIGFGELLTDLADDPGTRAVALYVEGLSPRGGDHFAAGLDRCRAAGKPVVVIKAGTSGLAAAVAQTHTRSLAADDRVWDSILSAGGAIRVRSVPEMADVLQCATSRRPAGGRVAVITDGGGDSVLSLDALASATNLVPATFDARLIDELEGLVPPAAPRVPGMNPLTLDTAGGVEDDPEVLARCLDAVVRANVADIVVVGGLFGTYVDQRAAEIRSARTMAATLAQSAVTAVFQAPVPPGESEPLTILAESGIPFFESVDRALRTLDRLTPAAPRPDTPAAPATSSDATTAGTAGTARREPAATAGRQWSATQASDLLSRHGIRMPAIEIVEDEPALLRAAAAIGYPICLKTGDTEVVHKSDVGGVRVGLANEEQVREAASELWSARPSRPLLVMPSLAPAFEMLVGGLVDPHFGPVMVIGRGGVLAEVEADTRLVAAPVTAEAVDRAIAELRCYPVLRGYRSSPALDVAGLRDIVVALGSALATDPTLSVDLNPVLVYPDRCEIADIRVMSRDGAPQPSEPVPAALG